MDERTKELTTMGIICLLVGMTAGAVMTYQKTVKTTDEQYDSVMYRLNNLETLPYYHTMHYYNMTVGGLRDTMNWVTEQPMFGPMFELLLKSEIANLCGGEPFDWWSGIMKTKTFEEWYEGLPEEDKRRILESYWRAYNGV